MPTEKKKTPPRRKIHEAVSKTRAASAPVPGPPPAVGDDLYAGWLARAKAGVMEVTEVMNLGARLGEANLHAAAVGLYYEWLAHTASPAAYAVHFNMGVSLVALGKFAEAAAAYRNALALKPDLVECRVNLGTTLERLGDPQGAVDAWREALGMAPGDDPAKRPLRIHALNNLGRLLEIHKRHAEAEACLTESLLLDPAQPNALTHWVHLRQKLCAWPVYRPFGGVTVEAMREATSALAVMSLSDDPAEQLAAGRRFAAEKVRADGPPLAPPDGYAHDRLRVGYLSSDLRLHAITILTAELFELHDRRRVEVHAFCWSPDEQTPMQERVRRAFDRRHLLHDLSDEAAARLIREQEIDILVDLHGLTSGARPNILARRPAPVQITYLGLPGTTGLPGIDYVIADDYVITPEARPFYSEEPLLMPRCYQVNDRKRAVGPTPPRAALGLPEGAFVFCGFNNTYKITEETFSDWMRILEATPGSLLWLLRDDPVAEANLRAEAGKRGVDPGRLVFAERAAPADYLGRLRAADLFLDTFPFNGGTTVSDCLWAGLPVLTRSGRTYISRMAGSLLRAAGLPRFVTHTREHFVKRASALARDRAELAEATRHLRERRDTLPLFDTPAFVRDLEDAFERVARRPAASARPAPSGAAAASAPLPAGPAASAASVASAPAAPVRLFQIVYNEATREALPPGFEALDNTADDRHDWREYWPIRKFLLGEPLDEATYYGFLSPRFKEKTGLDFEAVAAFIRGRAPAPDAAIFCPQADMGAFFLNVFEQNDLFDPGFLDAADLYFRSIGLALPLRGLVMDSRQIVFSNYVVARPAFWRRWLAYTEPLFAACEGADSPLRAALTSPTNYPGAVERKVFLIERIASLVLALHPEFTVAAYNPFVLAWSASPLGERKTEAVICDALKIAMRGQGYPQYVEAFAALRGEAIRALLGKRGEPAGRGVGG